MSHIITQATTVLSIEKDEQHNALRYRVKCSNEHACVMLTLNQPTLLEPGERITVLYDNQRPVVIITENDEKHFVGESQLLPFYQYPKETKHNHAQGLLGALRFVLTTGMICNMAIFLAAGVAYLSAYMFTMDYAYVFASLASIIATSFIGNIQHNHASPLCTETLQYLVEARNRLVRRALLPTPFAISFLLLIANATHATHSQILLLGVGLVILGVLISVTLVKRSHDRPLLMDMPNAYANLFWRAVGQPHR